jgi:hypothetical protein
MTTLPTFTPSITLTEESSYFDFVALVRSAIRYVNTTPDDDRAEFLASGFIVRVRRVIVNTRTRLVLEYRNPWSSYWWSRDFRQIPEFATMLYDHRGCNHPAYVRSMELAGRR